MQIHSITLKYNNYNSFTSVESKKAPLKAAANTADNTTVNWGYYPLINKTNKTSKISNVSFGHLPHETRPLQRLYWITNGDDNVYFDQYTQDNLYKNGYSGWKHWVEAPANHLLKRSIPEAIRSISTLTDVYMLPDYVESPKAFGGDNWGRFANYIEINPRTLANHEHNTVREGIFGAIKLLPAIAPSADKFANCIVLSQLYPTWCGDGWEDDNASLYTMNLNGQISKNLTSDWLERDGIKMFDREQVTAFNDLAHLRGLKTGFRMLLSEGQMSVDGRPFDWNWHKEQFIDACVEGIKMGFDAIYFDSGKHAGGDYEGYQGVGKTPSFEEMQQITKAIRERSERDDIAFIGEKCTVNPKYMEMGFTAGTDWANASQKSSVEWESEQQKENRRYAAGPEVSNDNDCGFYSFEERLAKMENCLFGYKHIENKLPSYMQMHDLFPMKNTNTHEEMLVSRSRNYGYGINQHYDETFRDDTDARRYQHEVNKKFESVIYKN